MAENAIIQYDGVLILRLNDRGPELSGVAKPDVAKVLV